MILLVVLVVLATYRLTRLAVADAFPPAERFRFWVEARTGYESAWTYLVTCPWCMSIYIGALMVLVTDALVDGGLQAPVLVWLTASAVSGYLSALEPDE